MIVNYNIESNTLQLFINFSQMNSIAVGEGINGGGKFLICRNRDATTSNGPWCLHQGPRKIFDETPISAMRNLILRPGYIYSQNTAPHTLICLWHKKGPQASRWDQ